MTLIIRLANPKTRKEQLFRLEASVDDLKDPGEAYIVIEGKEYKVEVHY